MPTIKDVARIAGVSISTASYALNDDTRITQPTKLKVKLAAESIGYYPNSSARNLKRKKSDNIGVFIYAFEGPIFSNVLEGIHKCLLENNYNIVVTTGPTSEIFLKNKSVDAAIIFDNKIKEESIRDFSQDSPVVLLDRKIVGSNIYQSQINNYDAVYGFIDLMIDKNYKDFGYLSGPLDSFNNNERYEGFKDSLKKHNLNHSYYQGNFTTECGYKKGLEIIKDINHPKFIYCANDELAIGLIQACKECGINIGKDMFIAGFDNIPLCKYVSPLLSTIDVRYFNWGYNVAQFLIKKLRQEEVDKTPQAKTQILIRETC
jgi:LacI family transcriptional regulator